MLDFYRSTKIDNKILPIKFKDILEQQLAEYKAKWPLDGIDLGINVVQNEDFYSDDAKIWVILNNLISNAHKFQKDNEPHKKIDLSIVVSHGVTLIKIADNGIGIHEAHQKDVFNLFHRATQKNVGSGLGLYMVKESVDQIKGKIALESKVDEGTTIEITIPNLKPEIIQPD
jgi:signal transduction histidine kinase